MRSSINVPVKCSSGSGDFARVDVATSASCTG
jgi:hypothetical protein